MIISHNFVAHAPMEAVFDALTAERVLNSLRGVQLRGRDANGDIAGALQLDVAGTPLRFRGRLTSLEADREAGALTMTLTGNEGRSRQLSRCAVAVRLRTSKGSTTVSMQLDVDIAGRNSNANVSALREAVLDVLDDLARAVREDLTVAAAPAPAPPPSRPRYADPGSPVPGRVVVVTTSPLDGSKLPVGDSPTDRVRAAASERPWLPPLILLGVVVLLLLLRRRTSQRQD